MNVFSSQDLKQSIAVRYWLAASFIALLSTSALVSFSLLLNENEHSAGVVNISGKQRMLSQKTAFYSSQLVSAKTDQEVTKLKTILLQAIEQMERDHLTLIKGSEPLEHSAEIQQMYFGSLDVHNRHTAYTQAIRNLVLTPSDKLTQNHPDYLYIKSHVNSLIEDLSKIVNQYQREGEQQVQFIKTLAQTLWMITLIVLLLEIQFIFRPMNRQIISALRQRENHEQKLEEQVKQKTHELEKANRALFKLANTDPLTQLHNRRAITPIINELHRKFETQGVHYSVAIIDIDEFKKLNDIFGHECGDKALKGVADTLRYFLGENDYIARWGGEEFLIVLPNSDTESVFNIIDTLRVEVGKQSIKCTNEKVFFTFSAGISSTEYNPKINSQDLLRQADLALYEAKREGRNRVNKASS